MFTPLVISAAAGTILSGILSAAIGAGASAISRKKSEERQNQYNLDAEKRQQGYIDKQNEYNSPESQMNRFRAAGLNPYMVDDAGNQSEINSANINSALDSSDIYLDSASRIGSSIASGIDVYRNAYLQEKQYQLEVAKLEQQRQQFEDEMSERRFQFDSEAERKQIEHAYQVTRDKINDDFRSAELALKQQNLSLEQEKAARQRLESDRDYNLRLAQDGRDAQLHDLRVRYQQTQNEYNNDVYEFFKNFELPNKQLAAKLERLTLDLDDDMQSLVIDNLRKSLILKNKVQKNEISYQEYESGLRDLWNSRHKFGGRYLNGDMVMNNPYEEKRSRSSDSSISNIADLALKLFK